MHESKQPTLIRPHMIAACHANLLISCWRASVDVNDIQLLIPYSDKLLERYPAGIGTMNVVESKTSAPDEAREAGAERINQLGERLLCTTNVLLGAGMWIAGARAITSMFTLLSRRSYPTWHTDTVADAVRWQAPRLGEPDGAPVPPEHLEQAVNRLLERFRR